MRAKSFLLFALLPVALAGCGARHFEYHSATEIPEGPGMLSGKDGAFTLYSDKNKAPAPTAEPAGAPAETADDYREFREFQEFKRWKEANRDSPEFREFREWQEWKAFRAWQKSTR